MRENDEALRECFLLPSMKKKTGKKKTHRSKGNIANLGFVIDAYRGKLRVLQIGEAGEGELAYKVSQSGDIVNDWRDESEVSNVHLTAAGKREANRIRRIMR